MSSSKAVKSQKKPNAISSQHAVVLSSSQANMSTGKKRHRRRRKLTPTVSSCITEKNPPVELIDNASFVESGTIHGNANKENHSSHLNDRKIIIIQEGLPLLEKSPADLENVHFSPVTLSGKGAGSSCPTSRSDEGKTRKKRNQKSVSNTEYALQSAIKNASHPITSLKLIHVVAEASAYFPNSLPEGSLLLEEKKVDIINVARKCIRSATSTSDVDINSQLANLKVAIHCLRAITPILSSIPHKEIIREDSVRMVIKLLYHCINTSKELHLQNSKEIGWTNCVSIGAAMVCFAGYQVLGVLLRSTFPGHTTPQQQHVDRYIFDKFPIHSSDYHASSSSYFSSTDEDFTKEKITKIAVQSCFSVSSVLWNIHYNSMLHDHQEKYSLHEELVTKEELNEYGYLFKTIILATLTRGGTSSSSFAFRRILCSVSMSWILSLVMSQQTNKQQNGNNAAKTSQITSVLGYTKRVSRLLIDAASKLESILISNKVGGDSRRLIGLEHCEVPGLRDLHQENLMLRRDYVLVLLLNRQIDDSTWIPPPSTLICDQWPLLRQGFINACSSAWKFAAAHAQIVSDGIDAIILNEYHQAIGSALDKIAFSQEELNHSYVEYCTYRAIHSGHYHAKTTLKETSNCSEEGCIFHHLPFRYCHQRQFCCQQTFSDQIPSECIALATFFVALANKYSNYDPSQGCDEGPIAQRNVPDNVINLFKEKILKSKCEINDQSLRISYKVLALLKLNTTVFNAVNSMKVEKISSVIEHYKLSIFGRLLGECYAPLNLLMASRLQIGAHKYHALAVEGYTTSGMIFQLLGEASVESLSYDWDSDSTLLNYGKVILNCSLKSDKFINKCSKIIRSLQFDGTEYLMLERVGRSLSNLGKRRVEEKQNMSPLLPLLLSLDAFCRAYTRSPKPEYRISARFSQLASLLYSLRMRKEACISLLFSIRYQFHEYLLMEGSEEREKDCVTDLLLVCDEYLSNKFRSDSSLIEENDIYSSCLPLIKRLVRIYTELITNANDLPQTSLDQDTLNIIQRLFFGSVFMEVCNSQDGFFLNQIVRAIIMPYNQFGGKLSQQIGLVYNILHSLGNVVIDEDEFLINNDISLRELDNTLQQTCCSLKCKGELHHEYIAALFIAGAAVRKSIIKEEPADKIASPCAYVEQAEQLLCQSYEVETSCGQQVTLLAYHASVLFFKTKMLVTQDVKFHLNSEPEETKFSSPLLTHYEKVAAICSEAGKVISANRLNIEIINLPMKVLSSLVLTLVKVYQKFDIEDASIPAACHIQVLFDLVPGCEMMAGPLLFRGELHNSASLLAPEEKLCLRLEETTTNDVIQDAEMLCVRIREGVYIANGDSIFGVDTQKKLIKDLIINACQLQIHIHTTELQTTMLSIDRLITIMQQQHTIFAASDTMFDLVQNDTQDKADIILWLTVQWWLSSYTLALAEGYDRCGEIMAALHFARYSCIFSQSTVKMMRERVPAATSLYDTLDCQWLKLPFSNSSTRILPFISRIFYCQEYIGRFYSKVGDHKKAKQYALSLAESLGLLPRGFSIRNLKLPDTLRLVNSNVSTIRQMKCRRFLTHTLFLGMPPSTIEDSVGEHYVETFHLSKDCLSSSQVKLNLSTNYLDWLREKTRDLIIYGDFSLQSSNAKQFFEAAVHFSQNLRDVPLDLMKGNIAINMLPYCLPNTISCVPVDSEIFGATLCEVGLRLAQTLKANPIEKEKSIYLKLFKDVSDSRFASSSCRAEAFYNLGHEFLHLSKESGELHDLWIGNCPVAMSHTEECSSSSSSSSLQAAYCHFMNAASFAGPASSLLSRHILRCLALVSGPEGSDANECLTAGELVHTSIGSSARQAVARASSSAIHDLRNKEYIASSEESANLIFDAFDLPVSSSGIGNREKAVKEMYSLGCDLIPHDWKFIAMTICPTGELLLSSLELSRDNFDVKPRYRTVCIPTPDRSDCVIPNFFDEIMKPFDDLMYRSQTQLRGMDSENAAEKFKDKTAIRSWWDERQNIDDELQDVLNIMEERYFGAESVQDILINSSSVDDTNVWCNDSSKFSVGNLAAKFEAACAVGCDVEPNSSNIESNVVASRKESLQSKTVVKIKEDLMKYGIGGKSIRGLRKAALIDLLWNKMEEEIYQSKLSNRSVETSVGSSETVKSEGHYQHNDSIGTVDTNRGVIFLVLDEQLSRLPLEGIPTFRGKTVCRIPSLPFAIATLHRSKELSNNPIPVINPSGASYVLNPELDLKGTEQRVYPTLKKISESNEWDWKRVVGAFPSEDFMEAALKREDGLFMYCGHGGGERFFPRSRVMNLISNKASAANCGSHVSRQCHASVVLMGCSSGRLSSVNSLHGSSDTHDRIHYEPEGAALSYLCAGAPCVIGNLWDVTDRDIDRFFLNLIDGFLGTPGKETPSDNIAHNLAECVAESRMACKMRFIVGCAPVVYGVPVSVALGQSKHRVCQEGIK